jgi:hypothetical protein
MSDSVILRLALALVTSLALMGCGGGDTSDSGTKVRDAAALDAGAADAEATDAEASDAEATDAEATDVGAFEDAAARDAESADAESADAESADSGTGGTDAEPSDAGAPEDATIDASAPDASAPDAQAPDAAADAGPSDAGGGVDAGPAGPCVDGEEGCRCAAGQACNDPSLTCFNTSGPNRPPAQRVNICIRRCGADADCLASTIGNRLCRRTTGQQKTCVFEERAEGERIDLSRRRSTPMTGCADDLFAFPPFAGSGLTALVDDQAACGRPCSPAAPLGSRLGCTVTYPFCNPNLLTSTSAPGLCGVRPAGPGDVCSLSSAVGLCDTTPDGRGLVPSSVCIGTPLDLINPGDPTPSAELGMCVVTCNLLAPDCSFSDDLGTGPATCVQIRAANVTTGICSNQCSLFPSSCANPGGFGLGTSCSGELQFEPNLPFSFCRAVVAPVIPEWNFRTPPVSRCLLVPGGDARCQANTFCFDDGNGGVCVRTCNAGNPQASGCQDSSVGNFRCDDTVIGLPTDGRGACIP